MLLAVAMARRKSETAVGTMQWNKEFQTKASEGMNGCEVTMQENTKERDVVQGFLLLLTLLLILLQLTLLSMLCQALLAALRCGN